jgi:hypothetical protein
LPQAKVTIHNVATGVNRVVTADAAGNYSAPSLQPGQYMVTIQAAGFADYKVPSLTLLVDQPASLNAKL